MHFKMLASLALSGLLLTVGCTPRPVSTQTVDQSVLPAAAKSLLAQDAVITRVEDQRYQNGNHFYVIHYTQNGREKTIKYNAADESKPRYVFEVNK